MGTATAQPDSSLPVSPGEQFHLELKPGQKKTRTWLVGGANLAAYGGTMIVLNEAWYKNYPRAKFHAFNDWPEWKQVDKAGHLFSAYTESLVSMEMWRWTGMERKKRIWIGGLSGAAYQTLIEVLDGHSAGWGWSWPDFGANLLGSGALVAQELAWDEQRVRLKYSFHGKSYADPQLEKRKNELFGEGGLQRMLKDYNGQTYWASLNLHSFFPGLDLPRWLSISVGYGAEGMFGGRANYAEDKNGNTTFNRPDIKRYRQWYLSPDIDLSRVPVRSRALRIMLGALNAFKFPAPALEFSNGTLKGHLFYF